MDDIQRRLYFDRRQWTIRELTADEYPCTQLRYEVRDETGDVLSVHHWEEDAKQMASVPQLRDALYDAMAFIEEAARYGIVPEKDALTRIQAAIVAVKGE